MPVTTSFDLHIIRTNFEATALGDPVIAAADGGYVYGGFQQATGNMTTLIGTVTPAVHRSPAGLNMALAGLAGGRYVAVTQDADSILYQIFGIGAGTTSGVTGVIDIGDTLSTNPDVAALKNGGFVIASQDFFGGTDFDIELRFYNSAGVLQLATVPSGTVGSDRDPSVAVMAFGNVAVGWTCTVGTETEVWYAVFSQTGAVVKAATLLDTTGTINDNVEVAASGSGFAITYRDNDNPGGVVNAAVRTLTDTGVALGSLVLTGAGNIADPAIAQLSNGQLAISWNEAGGDLAAALIDPGTMTVLSQTVLEGNASTVSGAPQIAGYGAGRFALVAPITSDGLGGHAGEAQIYEIAARKVLTGDAANDTINAGSEMSHHLLGNGGKDILSGGVQDDELDGGEGNDSLDGKLGHDVLGGGAGNDLYFVDSELDVIFELAAGGTDKVTSSAFRFTLSGDIESLTLVGDAFAGEGNASNNTITGNQIANRLIGFGGNDKLDGRGGGDFMDGGAGNDTYFVDNLGDFVIENIAGKAGGKDTVILTFGGTIQLAENVENGIADGSFVSQALFGNELANTLTSKSSANGFFPQTVLGGEGGKDVLKGGAGADALNGGPGADILTGGGGRDNFVFRDLETSANKDTIKDFSQPDIDLLLFDDAVFVGLTGFGSHPEMFALGASATTSAHRLIYQQATGNLFYDADGTGAAAQVLVAVLTNKPVLGADDFMVI